MLTKKTLCRILLKSSPLKGFRPGNQTGPGSGHPYSGSYDSIGFN